MNGANSPTVSLVRPVQGFEVDGQRFDSADGVIRYLLANHTKKELVELILALLQDD